MGAVYRVCYWICAVAARALFRYRAVGAERIPAEGPAILAMNHESYLDPPMAGIATRRPVHFLARRTLLKWPVLGPLFPFLNVVPVDQDRADMSALKTIIKLVRAGHCVLVFPEGQRTEDGSLGRARPGIGLVIAKTLAPVVPMRIFGSRDALPRGGGRFRLAPITVVVGEPIRFRAEDVAGEPREVYQALSDRVMEQIAALRREER